MQVYVRPAGSYVMDRLELRRVALYPGDDEPEAEGIVILVGHFSVPAGLRAVEAALSDLQVCLVYYYPQLIHTLLLLLLWCLISHYFCLLVRMMDLNMSLNVC